MNQEVLNDLSYGVYVVSTLCSDTGKPAGCIANSLMQITYDTIAVSIHHENYTNICIEESKKFGVSILGENVDNNIIPIFGFQSAKNIDKFENFATRKIDNLEILEDSVGYLICEVVNKLETETHTVFLGKIIDGDIIKQDKPMTYAYYHAVKKGLSPKNAPTYIESKKNTNGYRCQICGYIYEGDLTKEPDTYLCPICKKPKDVFVKI